VIKYKAFTTGSGLSGAKCFKTDISDPIGGVQPNPNKKPKSF